MAFYERREYNKAIGAVGVEIHDSNGHTAHLTIAETWELLEWLDDRRDALFRELHPVVPLHQASFLDQEREEEARQWRIANGMEQ